jgi:hypothetical protein
MSERGLSPEPQFKFTAMPKGEGRGAGKAKRNLFARVDRHLKGQYRKKDDPLLEAALWAVEHGRSY